MALNNDQIGAFRELLSDPASQPDRNLLESSNFVPIIQTPATRQSLDSLHTTTIEKRLKKKSISSQRAKTLQKQRASIRSESNALSKSPQRLQSLTPPPAQMELIRPGKRRVKVTANAVENTPSKRMRVV